MAFLRPSLQESIVNVLSIPEIVPICHLSPDLKVIEVRCRENFKVSGAPSIHLFVRDRK